MKEGAVCPQDACRKRKQARWEAGAQGNGAASIQSQVNMDPLLQGGASVHVFRRIYQP